MTPRSDPPDGAEALVLRITGADSGVPTLAVAGEVDMLSGPEFADALRDVIAEAVTAVQIDLREVTYFGSDGVQGLVRADHLARQRSVELTTLTSPIVARTLEASGLSNLVDPKAR